MRVCVEVYDYNEDNSISRMDLFEGKLCERGTSHALDLSYLCGAGLNQNNQSQPYAERSSPQRIIAAINRLFQLLDTDGSGELLFEDFRQLVTLTLTLMDPRQLVSN